MTDLSAHDPVQRDRRSRSLLDWAIVRPAIGASFKKLNPRSLILNPVMFVVEVVAAMTTIILARDLATGEGHILFEVQIAFWLWFTVVFANFAEAVAEGRGKAQAEELRKTRTETIAKRWPPPTPPISNWFPASR